VFKPSYHITRQREGAATRIQAGDVLWLIGQIFSPWGTLAPGLDAKINVDSVRRGRNGETKFIAGRGSAWFPLHNGT
jgi:hypothetical protein